MIVVIPVAVTLCSSFERSRVTSPPVYALVSIPAAAIATVVSEPTDVTVAPVKLSETCDVPLEVPPSLVSTPETTPSKLLPSP